MSIAAKSEYIEKRECCWLWLAKRRNFSNTNYNGTPILLFVFIRHFCSPGVNSSWPRQLYSRVSFQRQALSAVPELGKKILWIYKAFPNWSGKNNFLAVVFFFPVKYFKQNKLIFKQNWVSYTIFPEFPELVWIYNNLQNNINFNLIVVFNTFMVPRIFN